MNNLKVPKIELNNCGFRIVPSNELSLLRCASDFVKIISLKEYKHCRRKEGKGTEWRAKKRSELYEYIGITFKLKETLVIPKNRPSLRPFCSSSVST